MDTPTLAEVVAESARLEQGASDREFVELAERSWNSGACWGQMMLTVNGPGWARFPLIQHRKLTADNCKQTNQLCLWRRLMSLSEKR